MVGQEYKARRETIRANAQVVAQQLYEWDGIPLLETYKLSDIWGSGAIQRRDKEHRANFASAVAVGCGITTTLDERCDFPGLETVKDVIDYVEKHLSPDAPVTPLTPLRRNAA